MGRHLLLPLVSLLLLFALVGGAMGAASSHPYVPPAHGEEPHGEEPGESHAPGEESHPPGEESHGPGEESHAPGEESHPPTEESHAPEASETPHALTGSAGG